MRLDHHFRNEILLRSGFMNVRDIRISSLLRNLAVGCPNERRKTLPFGFLSLAKPAKHAGVNDWQLVSPVFFVNNRFAASFVLSHSGSALRARLICRTRADGSYFHAIFIVAAIRSF